MNALVVAHDYEEHLNVSRELTPFQLANGSTVQACWEPLRGQRFGLMDFSSKCGTFVLR